VYAGAAREAVFSVPEVMRRIQAEFVPLALRAPLVNGADQVPDKDERWLYQRVNRVKLAPQGICLLDGHGRVLVWTQMFDDDRSVLDFLDHGLKRFQESAASPVVVATQRYMRFPGERLDDFEDQTKLPLIADAHPQGKRCPAQDSKPGPPPGGLSVRLVGRALDDRGKPVADVVKQEHYVEDQFSVPAAMQKAVMSALGDARAPRVRLPDDFSKLCATHAHLGHIDVQPCLCMVKNEHENRGAWKRCELWAEKDPAGNHASQWRLTGQSDVESAIAINGQGVHNVKLTWQGFLELKEGRLLRLVLSGRGTEKLQFANDDHPLTKIKKDEVAFLPAGRPIDLECGVRYGILGEPATGPVPVTGQNEPVAQLPDEARKQLVEALGGAFIIFRDKVQHELKLSDEQQQKLQEQVRTHVQDTMNFFDTMKDLKPEEQPKRLQEHRRKSEERLTLFLKETLDARQQHRLFQVQLQQAGAFALLGQNEAFLKLNITDQQREKFFDVHRDMEKTIQALMQQVPGPANPSEMRPKVMKIRKNHEARIQALLSERQKKQWQELLGKPLVLDD
jgi:hypothetical protein